MLNNSDKVLSLQIEVFSIIIITSVLLLFLFLIGRAIKKSDPLAKPKGLVLIGMIYYQMMSGLNQTYYRHYWIVDG